MKDLAKVKCIYTHGGTFHADDVFGVAVLTSINPELDIVRTLNAPEDSDDKIIFDIGLGEYDHHQTNKALRPNDTYIDKTGNVQNVPYCGVGLLWRNFGHLLVSDRAWRKIDRDLILPIDKTDNGIAGSTLSGAIGAMNPTWDSDSNGMVEFMAAVKVAKTILYAYIAKAEADARAEELVISSQVVNGHTLVLNEYMPWQDVVVNEMPDILYIIFPSNRGGYAVWTVPNAPGSFVGRKLFPTEWLGNPDESLGMFFCHPNNFCLSCHTQEQAINAAKIAAER